MLRLGVPGLLGTILIGLWIYCILDVIATEAVLMRNLPKSGWLFIVIFIPDIGSIAWLTLGRPPFAGWRPGDTNQRSAPRPRVLGPDDDPYFGGSPRHEARLEAWEDDLARREAELRKREQDE